MTKKIYSMCMAVALLVAGVAMSGCKKDNNNPDQPKQVQTYKMSIQASKGTDRQANGPRRVLSLDGPTLNATWQAGEQVTVYNATKGADLTGYLVAQTSGANVQLEGTLEGTIEAGDKLTLKYLSANYTGQDGTIEYISEHCDYAVAEDVEVVSVSGSTIYTTGTADFVNQQAIVKFTLIDAAAPTTSLNPTALAFNDGTADIATLTIPAATYTTNGEGVLYVAVPGFSGKDITLTATVGSDTYTYEKASATLTNGRYYTLTAEMTKQAAPAYKEYGPFSVGPAENNKQVYFSQGNLQFTRESTSVDWSTGKFSFMDHQYDYIETTANPYCTNDYANKTAIGLFGWATSNINDPANTSYLPTNTNTTNASYGSGITSGNVNWATDHANYDWGANTGDLGTGWRTLTTAEWQYLFESRTNASNLRTWATVNGVTGMILMPDGWTADRVSLTIGTGFGTNDINTTDWATLEGQGCVFLPATGYRDGTKVYNVGSVGGDYWSSTSKSGTEAYYVDFDDSDVYPDDYGYRRYGCSVRLVKNAN